MNTSDKLWIEINICPLCRNQKFHPNGILTGSKYIFGKQIIPFPSSPIEIRRCSECDLIYKSIVPSKDYVSSIITDQIDSIWNTQYGFDFEIDLINNKSKNKIYDVLDIGASGGGLLCSISPFTGRRSALDIVAHPDIETVVNGELILGLIDEENLQWSGDPYDVVTCFDIFEHLYDPISTLLNLQSFLRNDGLLLIETGNPSSFYPARYGLNNWWYLNLFEHHLVWSNSAINYAASRFNFTVNSVFKKKHKYIGVLSKKFFFRQIIKTLLYRLSPIVYHWIYNLTKINGFYFQPSSFVEKDHHLFVLQKKSKLAINT